MKRLFDIILSLIVIILLFPIFIVIGIIVGTTSPGGVFFRGIRIGKNGKPFKIFKFRSMVKNAEGNGKWNVGDNDARITPIGHFLRNTKIDELPQLFNVLKGDMTFVGPRPELKFYVDMYNDNEKKLLDLKPGITDWASITNFDQFEKFTKAMDPDELYLKYIRPLKLELQKYYRSNCSFSNDLRIMLWTFYKVVSRNKNLPKDVSYIVERYKLNKEFINNSALRLIAD